MRFKKKWKKVLQPDKGKYGIYKKAGIVLLLSIVMFSAVYVTDNHRQLAQDENGNRILERKGQGEGKKTENIQMETGEWKEKIKVQISEKKYAKEEIGEQLSKAAEELPAQILGENKSLDEVRSDLNLIMEIPHTGISVSWELDNYEVMNSRGVLKKEKLTEEGTLVKLTAVLRYDEEKMSCEFYAHLFSTPLSKKEGVLKKISQEVEKADQEQREKDYLILPDQVDGRKLSWKPVKEMRAFGILLLGGVMIVFQFTAEKQKQKEKRKKEIRQMQFDYPQLINKFSLYIGAGMTVRRAWIQIVKEYDKEKHYLGERTVYEEMRYTMNELKNGRPESECYEAFGRRCESPVYRKFGMLLSQNLRKGTKGLTNLLQREAQEAFEERKNMARGRNKVDDTVVSYVGSRVRDRDCSSVFDDSDLRKKREKKERYKMRKLLVRKNKDKKYVAAITTIELVLILVILIALLLIFKEQLISLITTIFEKVTSESSGI